ncbi:hypothetical protein SUDANB145_00658 [Streptomyces sp. enrichment culture]|uniref:hypothetical protein n=1 Tax=Streptomyces sp. enrichment culture TaxID=1795815 RepID=UPI003F55B11B
MTTKSAVTYVQTPFDRVGLTFGNLEVFACGTDGSLQHNWQTAPGGDEWSGWHSLGGHIQHEAVPAVALNQNGQPQAFIHGTDGRVHARTRDADGSWSGWLGLGGAPQSTPALAMNWDGRLEAFITDTDGNVGHLWQTTPNSTTWDGGWKTLFSDVAGLPVVLMDSDGRLEAFCRGNYSPAGSTCTMLHAYQRPHVNGWAEADLGGDPAGDPTVVRNISGQLEVFVLGSDGSLQHIWQTKPSNTWSNWAPLPGGDPAGRPAVGGGGDGTLDVFARQENGTLRHIWQTRPAPEGQWASAWAPLYSGALEMTSDPAVATDAEGRLQVFALFGDHTVRYIRQNTPDDHTDWSPWQSLDVPRS